MTRLKAENLSARNIGSTVTFTASSSGAVVSGRLMCIRRSPGASHLEIAVEGSFKTDLVHTGSTVDVVLPATAHFASSAATAGWELLSVVIEEIASRRAAVES